jgi:hypothetical protein
MSQWHVRISARYTDVAMYLRIIKDVHFKAVELTNNGIASSRGKVMHGGR